MSIARRHGNALLDTFVALVNMHKRLLPLQVDCAQPLQWKNWKPTLPMIDESSNSSSSSSSWIWVPLRQAQIYSHLCRKSLVQPLIPGLSRISSITNSIESEICSWVFPAKPLRATQRYSEILGEALRATQRSTWIWIWNLKSEIWNLNLESESESEI